MKISERIKQREAAAATRRAQRTKEEAENLWDVTCQWESYGCRFTGGPVVYGRWDDAMNAHKPKITPEDLATVETKKSVWQQIKGWLA